MARRSLVAGLIAVLAVALATRVPELSHRPMHGDEAVHAVKCWELYRTGQYVYDPFEFHGPTLYYATLPLLWLSGAAGFADTDAAVFRLTTVLFSIGALLILWLIADGIGRDSFAWAALFAAVSPAMVFYGRYYIQESLLVFFTAAAIGCGWRWFVSRRPAWGLAAGVFVGLMHATKETAIIAWGCIAAAWVGTALWSRRELAPGPPAARRTRAQAGAPLAIALGAVAAVATSVLAFTAGLTQPRGALDSLRAYAVYFGRAGGDGEHAAPWHYYLHLLGFWRLDRGPVWSEGAILLLALTGMAVVVLRPPADRPRRLLLRFLALYALLMSAVYSALPYKTPWSFLGALHALIILAGIAAAFATTSVIHPRGPRHPGIRVALGVLLVGLALHLGWQSRRAGITYAASPRNPYVYAQPLHGVERLVAWVDQLAAADPEGRNVAIQVVADNPWPLPWYLRRYARVGYWERTPVELFAPIVIAAPPADAWIAELPGERYQASHYGLRPDVVLTVFCDRALYQRCSERMRAADNTQEQDKAAQTARPADEAREP